MNFSFGDPYPIDTLLDNVEDVLKNASDDCKKLLTSKGSLEAFQKLRNDGKIGYGQPRPGAEASTFDDKIALGSSTFTFNPTYAPLVRVGAKGNEPNSQQRANKEVKAFESLYNDSKATSRYMFAQAAVIHEFLHAVGVFEPDSATGDSSDSRKNQRRVVENCFLPSKKK